MSKPQQFIGSLTKPLQKAGQKTPDASAAPRPPIWCCSCSDMAAVESSKSRRRHDGFRPHRCTFGWSQAQVRGWAQRTHAGIAGQLRAQHPSGGCMACADHAGAGQLVRDIQASIPRLGVPYGMQSCGGVLHGPGDGSCLACHGQSESGSRRGARHLMACVHMGMSPSRLEIG